MIERPSFGLIKTEASPLDAIERDEELAQRDMQDRARRLAAFKQATTGKVWWQSSTGEWFLINAPGAQVLTPARARDVKRLIATLSH